MMDSLFKREPVTLAGSGFVPAFTREEAKLHLKNDRVEVGGGGFMCPADDDYDPAYPKYRDHWSITILGVEIKAKLDWYSSNLSEFEMAATIANEFMADETNRVKHTEVWSYLAINSRQLNNSKRYWHAMDHRARIDEQIEKIKRLQAEVERAEVIASMRALEVIEGKEFTKEQRLMHLTEFNGGEWKEER